MFSTKHEEVVHVDAIRVSQHAAQCFNETAERHAVLACHNLVLYVCRGRLDVFKLRVVYHRLSTYM